MDQLQTGLLFDHIVGAGDEPRGNFETQGL